MSAATKRIQTIAKPKTAAAKPIKTAAKTKRPVHPPKQNARNLTVPHAHVPVDDALRAAGLGELRFAETLGLFIERVSDKKGQEKLLLDGLKEWGRQFERTRPAERAAASDAPVIVQLIHNVPRPERAPAPKTAAELPPPPDSQGPPKPPNPIVQ